MYRLGELAWSVIGALQAGGVDFDYDLKAIRREAIASENEAAEYWWRNFRDLESLRVMKAVCRDMGDRELNMCPRTLNSARAYVRRHAGHLLVVFDLVIKNGENMEASVCQMMELETKAKPQSGRRGNARPCAKDIRVISRS